MKKIIILLLATLVLFISAENGAQDTCLTCPKPESKPRQSLSPYYDKLGAQMDSLIRLQDSLLKQVKKEYKKACRPWLGRSETYQLLSGRYRYDWYYDRNGYHHVEIKKL